MKLSYDSWYREDINSYGMFIVGSIFTMILIGYLIKHIDVFLSVPKIGAVVAGVSIGGTALICVVGLLGIKRWGGYYSKTSTVEPNALLAYVSDQLSQSGHIYEINSKKPSWYFFIKPKHIIDLIQYDLNIEIFSFNDVSSSLYVGPKTKDNEEVFKDIIKKLKPAGNIYMTHKILSSYGGKTS